MRESETAGNSPIAAIINPAVPEQASFAASHRPATVLQTLRLQPVATTSPEFAGFFSFEELKL